MRILSVYLYPEDKLYEQYNGARILYLIETLSFLYLTNPANYRGPFQFLMGLGHTCLTASYWGMSCEEKSEYCGQSCNNL